MSITVRGAKNYKDRNLPLSENILLLLREYYKEYSLITTTLFIMLF
jgi:hypothetical protein